MSMAKNQFDVFERIQAIRELLKPVLSDKEMQRLSGLVLRLQHFRVGRVKELSVSERQAFDLLLKHGFNPKTVYEWLMLECVPSHIKKQMLDFSISLRDARYEFVKWKRMSFKCEGGQLMERMKSVIGGLQWESQEC